METKFKIERVKGSKNRIRITEGDLIFDFDAITVVGHDSLKKRFSGAKDVYDGMHKLGGKFTWVDNNGYLPVTLALGILADKPDRLKALKEILTEINNDHIGDKNESKKRVC